MSDYMPVFDSQSMEAKEMTCINKALLGKRFKDMTPQVFTLEGYQDTLLLKHIVYLSRMHADRKIKEIDREHITFEEKQRRIQLAKNDHFVFAENITLTFYAGINQGVPHHLTGRFTDKLMKNPVISPTGITYDRDELMFHMHEKGNFDPIVKEIPLQQKKLIPNWAVKEAITSFKESSAGCFY